MGSGHGKILLSRSRRGLGWVVAVLLPVVVAPANGALGEPGDRAVLTAQAAPGGQATETTPVRPPFPGSPPEVPPGTPPSPTIPSVAPPVFLPLPPMAARFEVHPSVELSEQYSDNFRLSEQDKEENLRSTAAVGLSLLMNAAFTKGQLAYQISGNHDTADDETSLFHSLQSILAWQATPRLTLAVLDALKRTDAPGEADQLNLRRGRRTFTSNTAGVDAGYALGNVTANASYRLATFSGEGTAETLSHTAGAGATVRLYQANRVSVGYQFLRSDVSGTPTAAGSDVTGHQVTLSLARQLNPLASAGVSGSYGWRDVSSDAPGVPGEDYSVWSASLFAGYGIPDRWSVTASAGYNRLDARRAADEAAITGGATLQARFAQATLTLSANSGFSETFATGENFGVAKTRGVLGSLSYPLAPSLTGIIAGFYRHNDFTSVVIGEAGRTEAGTTEDTWGGTVRLSVQLTRWLTLALEYGYTEAASPTQGREYTENRARVTATAAF